MLNYFKTYSIKNNKHFYSNLLKLAIPMGFIALLNSSLNLIDNLMISQLGKEAVAAVGSSNKVFFILMLTLFGVNSGFGAFISQFWGTKDFKRIQTVLFTAICSGSFIALLVTILALNNSSFILKRFSDEPLVIQYGIDYLSIVAFSYIISAILFSFDMTARSTENAKLPLIAIFFGLIVNASLNYTLIFGHFGFEAMGVKGAAIATLIARSVQLMIYIIYIILTKNPVLLIKLRNLTFESVLFKRMLLKTSPVVLNELMWAGGLVFVFIVYGKLGTDALASIHLFDTLFSMLTVFTWGISSASAIMIGKKLGESDLETAKIYTRLFVFNSITLGSLTSLFFLAFYPFIPNLFSYLDAPVIHNLQMLLLVMIFYTPFKLLSNTFIIGILRSAGDTFFALLVEGGALWAWSVPIAFLLVYTTSFTLPIVYIFVNFELIIKTVVCYIRYKKGNYIHNLIH